VPCHAVCGGVPPRSQCAAHARGGCSFLLLFDSPHGKESTLHTHLFRSSLLQDLTTGTSGNFWRVPGKVRPKGYALAALGVGLRLWSDAFLATSKSPLRRPRRARK